MAVEYELTLTDYLIAQKLHAKWTDRAILMRNIIWTILLAITIVASFLKEYLLACTMIGAIAGSFFAPFFWNNFAAQIISRLKYRKLTAAQKNQVISISEEGVGFGVSQAVIAWKMFVKWKENQDYILAYLNKSTFLIIPKRIIEQGIDVSEIKLRLAMEVGDAT